MANMAKNEYHDIAQGIMNEENEDTTTQEQPIKEPAMFEEGSTLYDEVRTEMMQTDPELEGNEGLLETDGGIQTIVIEALQRTGGDPSQFASALGMAGEEAAQFTAEISQATDINQQAEMIDQVLAYASPGPEAIAGFLESITDEAMAQDAYEQKDVEYP